jgi:hypothetical protein
MVPEQDSILKRKVFAKKNLQTQKKDKPATSFIHELISYIQLFLQHI